MSGISPVAAELASADSAPEPLFEPLGAAVLDDAGEGLVAEVLLELPDDPHAVAPSPQIATQARASVRVLSMPCRVPKASDDLLNACHAGAGRDT